MIFKTFNSDIDKISAKWGMFGRSFNDIGTAIVGRIGDINKGFQATDDLIGSIKDSDSIWKRLYPSKETIKSQLIDVDALYPDISDATASKLLTNLQKEQILVNANKKSWKDYFNNLSEGEKWQIEFVQNTDLQKASINDVKKSYEGARKAAIAHNAALKQQTLGAKAAAVAMKALAIAGNMIAMWAITKGIELAVKGIDELAHSAEHCKERVDELVSNFESGNNTIQQHDKTISNISSRYNELSSGVNELGGNVSLTNKEYSEYQDICNQIAEMYPTLVKSYDEQGVAILKLKGNVEALTQSLLDERKANAAAIIESDEVMKNYQNTREHGRFDTLGDYFSHFFDSQDEITASMIAEQERIQKYKDFLQMSYEDIISLSSKMGADRETVIQRGLLSELGIDSKTTEEEFNTFRTDLQAEIVTIQASIDQALSAVKTKAGAYLLYNENYSSLNEDEINIISSLLNDIDEATANSFGNDDKMISAYVNQVVDLIHNATPEVQKAINDWFILGEDTDISTKATALDTIIKSYEDNGLVIPVYFEEQKGEFDELQRQYDDAVTYAKELQENFDWDSWFKENSINTQEEIDRWLEIAQAANSAAEARKSYLESSGEDYYTPFDLDTFKDTINSIESGYKSLLDAKQEYEDNGGFLSPSTISSLTESGLIQYLEATEEGIRFNTDAYLSNTEAVKANAIQQLYNAMCHDVEAIAIGNTSEVSAIAQTAISNAGLSAVEAGNNAANAVQGWYAYGAGLDYVKSVLSDDVQGATGTTKKQIDATIKSYQNMARMVDNINVGKSTKPKSSSSKSSSSDPLKEAFTQEYNTLKHNLEMEYITEKQYYDSLDALNKKYFAGKSEYLDEYRKYEEEVYKGLKSYYKDYIDAYIKFQKQSLESGKIDYNTYCNTVSNLLKSMYKKGKIAAKDYWDYVHDNLESQLDIMDKVIAAVTNRIDKEIDFYQDQQEDIEDRYQTEIDYLDTVIKYYEDQKKALQDANDEKDRQLELEKALWNLKKAQTQRTLKLYTESRGFIYTVDNNAIKDASEEVANAKLDIEIAKLDKAIERVEQQQDALQDAMDREKEQLQQTIDRLEEYKEQWQSVADEYENTQNEMMAQQILGAEWETDILNCRIDTLTNFKNQYIALQQEMADAAWNSANEQIKAAQEAAKAASGSLGSAGSVGNSESSSVNVGNSANKPSDTKWEKQWNVQYEKQENQLKKKKKTTIGGGAGGKVNTMQRYGTGTDNAKPGYHKVAENGTEIIRDNHGNAFVVDGEQLYPFEGGETVIKASETKELLSNADNLVPVENIIFGKGENAVQFTPEELMQKWQSVMPDYTSMAQIPKFEMPKYDVAPVNKDNSVSVNIGDIHLHEVQNVDSFAKAIINQLPNKVSQIPRR